MTSRKDLIEQATDKFGQWDAPLWDEDPVARDAAVRWHLRGVQDALAVFEQAHTPTDEREALIEQATWALIDYDTDVVDRGVADEHYRERRADVERVFPILSRRTVQGEPSDALNALDEKWFTEWEKNQSIGDRWGGYHAGFAAAIAYCREGLRAALRAAGEARR